jgi:hypothetical protein
VRYWTGSLYDFTAQRSPLPPSDDFLFGTTGAIAAIEHGLALTPEHPGLLHLKIHALEMGRYGEGGPILGCVDAADTLLDVSHGTDCGHLLHMPAHIYCLAGLWQQAIDSNALAVEADEREAAVAPAQSRQESNTVYRCHNRHMLIYAAMFAGQEGVAMEHAIALEADLLSRASELPEFWAAEAGHLEAFIPMRMHVLLRFGRPSAVKPFSRNPVYFLCRITK